MRTRSASLRVADEDDTASADHPLGVSQPPQPEDIKSMQGISDTLFDFSEMSLDDSEGRSQRTRTARSGNPLLTVVHQSGVFDMELLFCICPNAGVHDEQLIQTGLFPSSFKQIETAFTFSVLEDFLTDNLECKTTAQQYYSKLQSISNRMFPDRVPVCHIALHIWYPNGFAQNLYKQLLRASRQWRDLTNRMKSGLGHQQVEGSPSDGSMATFCPACPQPGINLPDDWQKRYKPYVLIKHVELLISDWFKGHNSSEPLSWMVTSRQST